MKIVIAMVAGLCALVPVAVSHAQPATTKAKASTSRAAPTWAIDAAQSRIGFSTRWAGETVSGQFRQWSGDIRFDPANLGASKAVVLVQTGSARTGVKEPDENLGGGDWFDARRFPTARYETTAIRSLGGNRYIADGLLTIKGVSYRLALPFNLTIAGNVATMTGQATVDRMTLKLGLESDADAEWVARETTINVAVRATRR
jgi:polyisoprenoid-binding protein YceI